MTLYSTAVRKMFNGVQIGSKPFLVYYSGNSNIEHYIKDTCSLHYHFSSLKIPMPLFLAEKTLSWLYKYEIVDFDQKLTVHNPAL